MMPRYAVELEYHGAGFIGWQRQDAPKPSVQAVLEEAAARLCGHPVAAVAAGRTDSGVHAAGQVAHLDLPDFPLDRVREALNFHMKPHDVAVLRAAVVAPDWSARFDATGRRYGYAILNRRARPALARGMVWHVAARLDTAAMTAAAAALLGHHDFTSFRAVACQARSPWRTLDRLEVAREGDTVRVVAEARSFLHHQVRNIVGSLALVGTGAWPPERIGAALAAPRPSRRRTHRTAAGVGS